LDGGLSRREDLGAACVQVASRRGDDWGFRRIHSVDDHSASETLAVSFSGMAIAFLAFARSG
jgi:hypothetical protein